jgi:hypothetical protein
VQKKKVLKTRSWIVILSIVLAATVFSIAFAADNDLYLPIIFTGALPTQPVVLPGVHIPANNTYYVDSIGYLHVVGEVQNNTDDYLHFVQIYADFYAQDGTLLDTVTTYTYLDNLPPYTGTCFDILLPEPEGWSYYEFEDPVYWTDGSAPPDLTILNVSGSYDDIFGWYEITGQIRNDHESRIEYITPVGTLYNANNYVIGCDFTYVDGTHLEPDETSSFVIYFVGRDYYDMDHYRLQVDGDAQ